MTNTEHGTVTLTYVVVPTGDLQVGDIVVVPAPSPGDDDYVDSVQSIVHNGDDVEVTWATGATTPFLSSQGQMVLNHFEE